MSNRTLLFFISVIVLQVFISAGCFSANNGDKEDVIKALNGFYISLNAMFTGDAEPAIDVWSHSDDVFYMGANGEYNIGWENVYKDWQVQAALKLGGSVKHTDLHVNVGRDIAVTSQLVNSADPAAPGINKDISLRASSVFRKENGSWKMIGHHVDVIPELE